MLLSVKQIPRCVPFCFHAAHAHFSVLFFLSPLYFPNSTVGHRVKEFAGRDKKQTQLSSCQECG